MYLFNRNILSTSLKAEHSEIFWFVVWMKWLRGLVLVFLLLNVSQLHSGPSCPNPQKADTILLFTQTNTCALGSHLSLSA